MDRKGEFVVQYQGIAEETMKPKSPDSPFKESLRVVFGIKGEGEETVSLGIAIEDPADDLWGFVPDPDAAPANDEAALRRFVEANMVKEPVTVYVSGFVQSRVATEGTHTFERIIRIYQYTRQRDGQARIGMVAVTRDGETTSWTCPEPQFDKRQGETSDGDYIGPLSADVHAFQYLQMFGLDWERLENEDLANAKAFWPGHYDKDGKPVHPLFPDIMNPWPGFLRITDGHGWKRVRMEIERHPTYGLGPKQLGKGLVKMIAVEGDAAASAEFEREKTLFLELWDNATKAVLSKPDARFIAGGNLTEDGKAVALATLVPIIRAYPAAALKKKPDGDPAVVLPPTADTWALDGLVCANFTAERLLALEAEALFNVVNLGEPAGLLAWAVETVPEWATVGQRQSEGEVL